MGQGNLGKHWKWSKDKRGHTNHVGYRVCNPAGTTYLMPDNFPMLDYDIALREASARGGIVVRADWQAIEPLEQEAEYPELGIRPAQGWLESKGGPAPQMPAFDIDLPVF